MSKPFWKTKTFWGLAAAGESIASLIAWDRYQLKRSRDSLITEAEQIGEQPAGATLRKVTLISVAKDSYELGKIRKLWKSYAVDLFTKAGCDYQLMEVNCAALDKELDKRRPVPDGQIPEDKPIIKYFNCRNWLRPTMALWIQRLNPVVSSSEDDPSYGFDDPLARKLWEERRPEPRNAEFFSDGIVSLTREVNDEMQRVVEELSLKHRLGQLPRLGHIPCDPSSSFLKSIYYYFRKAERAEAIGRAALQIIKEIDTPQ